MSTQLFMHLKSNPTVSAGRFQRVAVSPPFVPQRFTASDLYRMTVVSFVCLSQLEIKSAESVSLTTQTE